MDNTIPASQVDMNQVKFWLLRLYNAARDPKLCQLMPEETPSLFELFRELGFEQVANEDDHREPRT